MRHQSYTCPRSLAISPLPPPSTSVQLLLLGRAALTLLTGRPTEMRFTSASKAGKNFRVFKGLPIGAVCHLEHRADAWRFLQLWRQEILPELPREYLGAGLSRHGNISTGVDGTLRLLQEISESFDRFRGFAWNGAVRIPPSLRHARREVAGLFYTGLGVPLKGVHTHEVRDRKDAIAELEAAKRA